MTISPTSTGETRRGPTPAQLAFHAAHLERQRRLWRRPAPRRAIVAPPPAAPDEFADEEPAPPANEPAYGAPFNFLKQPGYRAIIKLVALKHGVEPSAIIGPSRVKGIVKARDEAIWLVHTHCLWMSMPDLGRAFGGRDHSTMLHTIWKFRGIRGRLYAE